MRVVCLSDTHGRHGEIVVPDGDLLVVAGDVSGRGRRHEIEAFDAWLGKLPHPHKVLISGNHDFGFERDREARSWVRNAIYLQDELVEVAGLRVYGSPWQPWFYDWAFNLHRGPAIREKWDLIPPDVDVLLTHGPPRGILDVTDAGEPVGCDDLLDAVRRVRPRLHVFGHIHEGYGRVDRDGTIFVNASNCDVGYRAVNPPIVVDLDVMAANR
jgi:predicted phosphohydrolase